ncbi:alkaline phytoceramidase [Testicularia cyperi]|uniref:Alkaline phytoceramidase n=1 Tax=Testicularia cyperi TaxID=1882483 RepID=A0A317XNM2_9BASI|nr:alkaline phytoceramidase [Testicularia cyperi]
MSWYKDPEPLIPGYWGPITSTLLWCEEKYRWSRFVAEPINTITNIFFIGLSLYGFRATRAERLPLRFGVCHLGVALVGFGSAWFHATLLWSTQLLDELPMIYTSAFLTYCVFETSSRDAKPRFRILLPVWLITMVTSITVTYLYNANPVFHQVAYASIQILSTIRIVWLIHNPRSPLKTSAPGRAQKPTIENTFLIGTAIFILGFAIWNIDNIFCYHLRQLRNAVGFPASILLQGHGWWHILTGYGAFCIITAMTHLVLSYKESPDNFRIHGNIFPKVCST